MLLTVLTIIAFALHLCVLFQRSRFFYLHSFFLVPLYPVVFFVDHNAHFVWSGHAADSVHFVAKLLPLYLNVIYLTVRFTPRRSATGSFTAVIINVFLLYNVVLGVVYSVYHSSWLPLFYVSYSVPLFAIFFNSANFADEVARFDTASKADRALLQLYFLAFVFVYVASIYYSIRSGATASLLDSRGVGSVFASTSALIYCLMYAPLLAALTRRSWPHLIMIGIGVSSLSKTALLMLPAYGIMLYRRLRANIVKNAFLYSAAATLIVAVGFALVPEALLDLWKAKFALEGSETLLEKAYRTRLELYSDALRIIGDSPYGIGVGNFERFSHASYRDAHNFVLTVLCESGLVVGGLFILALVVSMTKTLFHVRQGDFSYWHFSLISIFLVYFSAAGVLQTTGTSDFSTMYYTPFYGVALTQLLNFASARRLRLRSSAQAPSISSAANVSTSGPTTPYLP